MIIASAFVLGLVWGALTVAAIGLWWLETDREPELFDKNRWDPPSKPPQGDKP